MTGTYHRRLLTIDERVASFLAPVDARGCRRWTGLKLLNGRAHVNGYGYIKVGTNRRSRVTRLLWERTHGAIPPGLCVCHTCDNPPCCNLDHLFLGSQADNVADKVGKCRQARAHRKLSVSDARSIIDLRKQGKTLRELGLLFGVTVQAIWFIVHGAHFSYVRGEA